jgi:hypothetical protein
MTATQMTTLIEKLDALDAERRRYTLETLAAHLDAAGRYGRLQSLFAGSDWMQARVRSNGFRYDGYLDDVAIGSRSARRRVAADEASLVQTLRLALVSTTVTSLAASPSPSLVGEAVERSIWPAVRAIDVAKAIASSLDQRALCWRLLEIAQLSETDREELQNLLDSVDGTPSFDNLARWAELRRSMDDLRGRWTSGEVVERSLLLLRTVEPLLTLKLTLDERTYDAPLFAPHRDADTERFRVAHEDLAKKSPRTARVIVLAKLKHLRAIAGGGFEAIRTIPGFTVEERVEAAALLTFALDPSAATLGLPKRALRKRALLLDADTVERIAGSLTAAQAEALVDAVRHSRARVQHYQGNPNRARALAALAVHLPERNRAPIVRAAVKELARMAQAGDKRRKGSKKPPKWRGVPMDVTDPDGTGGAPVMVFFDDQAVVDEGIDLVFSSYVEDLSDLEVEYAAFATAVEALADLIPKKNVVKLLGLALLPNRDYGWVCIRVISALEPRLTGRLAELRD